MYWKPGGVLGRSVGGQRRPTAGAAEEQLRKSPIDAGFRWCAENISILHTYDRYCAEN